MAENIQIDVQGLSCPQPVLNVSKVLSKLENGVVEVLSDSETSCENITRMARKTGWQVEIIKQTSEIFKIIIKK